MPGRCRATSGPAAAPRSAAPARPPGASRRSTTTWRSNSAPSTPAAPAAAPPSSPSNSAARSDHLGRPALTVRPAAPCLRPNPNRRRTMSNARQAPRLFAVRAVNNPAGKPVAYLTYREWRQADLEAERRTKADPNRLAMGSHYVSVVKVGEGEFAKLVA